MTREEAISLLLQVNHILVNSNSWHENTHEPLNIAFNMAIKALEQEPFINKPCVSSKVCEHDKQKVLEKIRAEIGTMPCAITSMREIYVNRYKVINIIDKYKTETEEE